MKVDKIKNSDVIGFDLDGVVIDHTENKIAIAKTLGFDLLPEQTASDFLDRYVPDVPRNKLKGIIYDDPQHALSPPLMPGIVEALSNLQTKKIKFFLITRRFNPALAIQLMQKHRIWPYFFNQTNCHFVKERVEKNTKAIELGLTHYIDDELKVLNVLTDVPRKFIFDPQNVHEKSDLYTILTSWEDFQEKLL